MVCRSWAFWFSAIVLTIAEPTTTASPILDRALTSSGVLMPKPMAMGSFVCLRICSMCGRMFSGFAFAAPVMPVTET
jgi:hypothetical protein